MKSLPTACPSCSAKLIVQRLHCAKCHTDVEGLYPLPLLASLSQDDQEFVLEFIKSSGSLKEMAGFLKVSYPTVRNRLDEVIVKLKNKKTETKEEK